MSPLLRLALLVGLAALLTSCNTTNSPTASKPGAATYTKVQKVRTTAYTHTERGGPRNAIGRRLSGSGVRSAASDWSRFPLGTRFRLLGTNEQYIIDDYGGALIGTSTIDLYKTSRAAMRRWGVRHVDIEIVQWGCETESLKILKPRSRVRIVREMIRDLEKDAQEQQSRTAGRG